MSIGPSERILEPLDLTDGFQVRRLRRVDPPAEALARSSGVHGVYVTNALAAGQAAGLLFERRGSAAVVAWFGPRGNLVLVCSSDVAGYEDQVADHVLQSSLTWRIALGDGALVDALRRRGKRSVLTHRKQIYYAGSAGHAASEWIREDLRVPSAGDRERLARATLALNAADLNIAPDRVDRRWLYNTIDDRIRERTTRVFGAVGALESKVDFGSAGPGGIVLEGVYTFPESRGKGLGASIVATCMAESDVETSLHVAEDNYPARRAYERAGMRQVGDCKLLLLG